ncbi:L-xylulose reductase-like [Mya arenaria]|uniref:L-xylulose reductase-like n=1 Tax=Mya arenaria TaxID=6604 RepID=UPI0022E83D2E|nr:L-xylulose reductase-like [Mya arenaria]
MSSDYSSFFTNKRVIVTGAGRGIGRQLSLTLSKYGAHVIAISKTEPALATLRDETTEIKTYCQDIRDWDTMRALLKEIGPVDMLVNNAFSNVQSAVLDFTEEHFDSIMETNVKAPFNITQVVTADMVANGIEGSVVNLSSIAGMRAFMNMGLYCTSKAALDMMTKSFALELGCKKIRVNSVSPTVVKTEAGMDYMNKYPGLRDDFLASIPAKRLVEIEEVVDLVVFLLSDRARMINGSTIPIDGGNTVHCMRLE